MAEQRVHQDDIDEANRDIVEVIGRYIRIKKAGKNWLGCCPFHKENTPSFTVEPGKSFFYCHGCGESGDAITFVRKHLNVSFRKAVESILGRLTLTDTAGQPKKPIERPVYCSLPSHGEDAGKTSSILARCDKSEQHQYFMRNNTAPYSHCLTLKGSLIVPIINNLGEEVNAAAISADGEIKYASGNPSYGSTAVIEPIDSQFGDQIIVLCVDYSHGWRIWWSMSGQCRVLCALDPGNFRWMLANCADRFTCVGCDPEEVDEFHERGFYCIRMPIDPYRKIESVDEA